MDRLLRRAAKLLPHQSMWSLMKQPRHFCTESPNDSIVISGISGRFANAENIEIFKKNLLGGVDMVRDQKRWVSDKIPKRAGFLEGLDRFDAEFFGVMPKIAEIMDPAQRKLLEVTFETLVDAGFNPEDLENTKTGVFVGAQHDDSSDHRSCTIDNNSLDGFGALGKPSFMLANRISYTFGFKGPSYAVSSGCSASLAALEAAVNSIKCGKCDAAIVAGVGLHMSPRFYLELNALGAISAEGKCKTFDHEADGYVRGEAVAAILLQKRSEARRSYASVEAVVSSNDGYKIEGIQYPSAKSQSEMFKECLNIAGIEAEAVTYIEAHGTGTPTGDPLEVEGIHLAYCDAATVERRSDPLIINK